MQRFSNGIVALILTTITLILCALKISDEQYIMGDGAGYIAQAIALAQGTTAQYIADNTLMMTKCDWIFGPTAYPWGYPALLAIMYKIFSFNIFALKSVGIICYALFVGIFYIFCANRLPKIYAIFATLLFVLNPFLTFLSANAIFSDIPFLLFGFCALIVLAKLFGESTQMGGGKIYAIVGGILMLFASLIRINGFVILCALIVMHGLLLANRFAPNLFKAKILKPFSKIDSPYSWKIHAIPYVIFIVGFAINSIALSSGGSGHFGALANISAQTILHNLKAIDFGGFISLETGVDSAIVWACVPFIALGIYANFKRSESNATIFYMIFVCGFFALLLLWVAFERRFVFVPLPFLIFWSFSGFAFVKQRLFGYLVVALSVLILINFAWLNARGILFAKSNVAEDDAFSAESKQMYEFISHNVPKNAIIITFKPRIIYLTTQRLGFLSPKVERLKEADFVAWNGKYMNDIGDMQDIASPTFRAQTKLIFENSEWKLFKVLK